MSKKSKVVYRAADAFGVDASRLFSDMAEHETKSAEQILFRELSRGEESLREGTAVTLEDAGKRLSEIK